MVLLPSAADACGVHASTIVDGGTSCRIGQLATTSLIVLMAVEHGPGRDGRKDVESHKRWGLSEQGLTRS